MTLNFDVKIDLIPIVINGIEFFFDATEENLIKFFDAKTEAEQRINLIKEEVAVIDTDNLTKEDTSKLIYLTKEELKEQYNVILGEGSFDKLYNVIPSVSKLSDLLNDISDSLVAELEKIQEKRKKDNDKKEAKYLIDKKKKITQPQISKNTFV